LFSAVFLLTYCETEAQVVVISLDIFIRATASTVGSAEARTSYGISVRPSVCPSRPGGIPSPGEIQNPGLHHMIWYHHRVCSFLWGNLVPLVE